MSEKGLETCVCVAVRMELLDVMYCSRNGTAMCWPILIKTRTLLIDGQEQLEIALSECE